jgi:two-component system, cell cycle response regulator
MDESVIKLLVVDDDEEDFLIVRELLSKTKDKRFKLTWAPTYEAGLELVDQDGFSAILVDYNLNQRNGLDFIRDVVKHNHQVPTILLTGQGSYEIDLQAQQAGADDFLMKKEINPPLLERTIRYTIEHKQIELKLRQDAERAELLANIARDFAEAGFNTTEMARKITRRISQAFGDAVIIRTLADDGKTLEPTAAYHPDQQAREELTEVLFKSASRVGEGMMGHVAEIKQARLLCDSSAEDLRTYTELEFAPWFDHHPADSVFVAPLCSNKRLIGTLAVVRNKPGGMIPLEDQVFYLDLANRAALAIENAMLHSEVEHLALTDSLTGFFNRRGFNQLAHLEIERHLRYGSPLSIVMLDIDHFKTVNDTYGHEFGDQVLKYLTESCTRNIRQSDIASRYGGDEFVILLPQTDLPRARKVANRIRISFTELVALPDDNLAPVTVSVGVTRATEETNNLDRLIRKADTALYLAKHKGRNRVEVL